MFCAFMHPELQTLVDSGKLAAPVAEKLSGLEPGTFCEHRSWGVGRIQSWDLLEGQIAIDFEDRPGHGMKLEFAAKNLNAVSEDHILVQRLEKGQELSALSKDDPVELIRRTLQSYGSKMSLDALDDVLKGKVIPEGEYKSWWDATKKKLRQNRLFVVPSKRTLPLEMRGEDESPSAALVTDFLEARDLKDKAKHLSSIMQHLEVFDQPEKELKPVIEDINAVAAKALKMHPLHVVDLLAGRDDLAGLVPELAETASAGIGLADVAREKSDRLGEVVKGLPVTRQRLLLASLPEAFGEQWVEKALSLLNLLGFRAIGEAAKFIIERDRQADLVEFVKRGLKHRDLSSDVLVWVCKERKRGAEEAVDEELCSAIMNSLEKDQLDEGTRKTNRLHDLVLDDKDLIPDLVREMDLDHVRSFSRRLMMTPVFDELNRRSLLARIIKVHSEIQELITGQEEEGEQRTSQGLVVSWESLERRKEELEELIKKKIPENSKEISIARSYGDLRENFEYKAAKQMQAVLMRRKSELEKELGDARGTDYADADDSSVSIGTVVTLEPKEDGNEVTYTILGAWDSDPENQVVAYLSVVGQTLLGKKTGDEVALASGEEDGGELAMRVKEIRKYVS